MLSIVLLLPLFAVAGIVRGLVSASWHVHNVLWDAFGNPKIGWNLRMYSMIWTFVGIPVWMIVEFFAALTIWSLAVLKWPSVLMCGPASTDLVDVLTCGAIPMAKILFEVATQPLNVSMPLDQLPLTRRQAALGGGDQLYDWPFLTILLYVAFAVASTAIHAVIVPVVLTLRFLWYIPAMIALYCCTPYDSEVRDDGCAPGSNACCWANCIWLPIGAPLMLLWHSTAVNLIITPFQVIRQGIKHYDLRMSHWTGVSKCFLFCLQTLPRADRRLFQPLNFNERDNCADFNCCGVPRTRDGKFIPAPMTCLDDDAENPSAPPVPVPVPTPKEVKVMFHV